MSMYNMVKGFNPACVLILPMLSRKSEDYPRFRDCFVHDCYPQKYYARKKLAAERKLKADNKV